LKESEAIAFPSLVDQAASPQKLPAIEWLRGSDGKQLGCRIWQGQVGKPVVLYLHGIEGHGQWFQSTAYALNGRGITVYALDRRGSGMNQRERGHLTDHRIFLADVEAAVRGISVKYSGHPIILMGNCWAAKACAIMARSDYKSIDGAFYSPLSGLILTCPAIYTKVDFDLASKIQIAAMRLIGGQKLLHYWTLPLTPSMYTNNSEYLKFIERDPLRLQEVTTSFLVETMLLSWRARRAAKKISMPVLIVQSAEDQIVDVKKIENWYGQMPSTNKTMRIFPEAYHSIDFDRAWFKEYTHLLSEWLLARSPVSV
jgi:alpha-beta hydrolase superfamily lysophospholipase